MAKQIMLAVGARPTELERIDTADGGVRYDFISHLSQRFGLAQDVVEARLGEWLLDTKHDNRQWQLELARR
jgi:hypothetical protein